MRLALSLALTALLGAVALVAAADDGPASAPAAACPPETLLVKFRPGVDAAQVIARHGATIASTDLVASIGVYEVAVPAGTVDQKLAEFQAEPAVEFAEPNLTYSVPEQQPQAGAGCPSR